MKILFMGMKILFMGMKILFMGMKIREFSTAGDMLGEIRFGNENSLHGNENKRIFIPIPNFTRLVTCGFICTSAVLVGGWVGVQEGRARVCECVYACVFECVRVCACVLPPAGSSASTRCP